MRSKINLGLLSFLLILTATPVLATAAGLKLEIPAGIHKNGDTFTARVLIDSPAQKLNAASASISFPANKLRIASISKTNSIFTLWPQEPSFSNQLGVVNMEAIMFGQDWSGFNGELGRINFVVTGGGSADIRFLSGSILSSDGLATDILTSTINANVSLGSETNKSYLLIDLDEDVIPAPLLDEYLKTAPIEEPLVISGRAFSSYGTATISVIYPNQRTFKFETVIKDKIFSINFIPPLPGLYELVAYTTDLDNNRSSVTNPIYIYVNIPDTFYNYLWEIISFIVILLLGIILLLWAHRTHYRLFIAKTDPKIKGKTIKILKNKLKAGEKLTVEEAAILKLFKD